MEGNQRCKPHRQRAAEGSCLRRSFSAQQSREAKGSGIWTGHLQSGKALRAKRLECGLVVREVARPTVPTILLPFKITVKGAPAARPCSARQTLEQ